MDNNTEKLLKRIDGLRVGVFIDNSNLFYAQKKSGWKIDYNKLKKLLSKYCEVKIYNFYVAIPSKGDLSYPSTKKYLDIVGKFANLRTKPLKYIRGDDKITKKGDVDLEIAIDVVRNIKNLDVLIIASGDSDYLELKNWVVNDNKKKILFLGFEDNIAWEIKYCWHLFFDDLKGEIEHK